MASTIYLFAQYFCWIQMLRLELSFELFRSQKEMREFFIKIDEVSSKLGDMPPLYDGAGDDVQVFRLQQRGMGELLAARRRDRPACRSYAFFISKWPDKDYSKLYDPLFHLLDGLQPTDRRWKGLEATYSPLVELGKECDGLLKLPGH